MLGETDVRTEPFIAVVNGCLGDGIVYDLVDGSWRLLRV